MLIDINTHMNTFVILARDFEADPNRRDFENAAAELIAKAGAAVWLVPHLSYLDDNDQLWQKLQLSAAKLAAVLTWLHPRPVKWLLSRHNIDVAEQQVFDLRTLSSAAACRDRLQSAGALAEPTEAVEPVGSLHELQSPVRQRWFPVIDYSRCQHCSQCMQFCLFGVYELHAGGVVVANADNCKNGCPACSRICPHGAIMFPHYKSDEAIAGAPGLLMKPDPAAKAKFYQRTGKRCPICRQKFDPKLASESPGASVCTECGLLLITDVKPAEDHIASELDSLIDELENLR